MIRSESHFAPTLPGRIRGTVLLGGDPPNPVRREVRLFRQPDTRFDGARLYAGLEQRAAVMSRADGSFQFRGLALEERFTVITYDSAGGYDPVMKGGLVPEVDD